MPAPASADSSSTTANGNHVGAPRANAAPVPRLETTTWVENTAPVRVMTGVPESCSARPPTEFIATSAAPLVTPTTPRPTQRLTRPWPVTAAASPAPPRARISQAVQRRPHRSSARPVRSIAGRAPALTNSKAVPRPASSRPAWSRTRGTAAPQVPQNAPNAAAAM
jgi:hypothetical protein